MLIETKASSLFLDMFFLSIPLFMLQIAPNLDIFQIADKAGVIAILIYMSYTLNKRIEKMFTDFQSALKEEREKADNQQKELLNIIIKLTTNEK